LRKWQPINALSEETFLFTNTPCKIFIGGAGCENIMAFMGCITEYSLQKAD